MTLPPAGQLGLVGWREVVFATTIVERPGGAPKSPGVWVGDSPTGVPPPGLARVSMYRGRYGSPDAADGDTTQKRTNNVSGY